MFNLNKKLTSVALLAMTSLGGSMVNISSISAQIQPAESGIEAVTTTTSERYNRNIDPQLKPSANEKVYLISRANGVQIYQCQVQPDKTDKYDWKFEAPEADLYNRRGYKIGKHYGGPTWEGNDGSKVVGKVKASVDYRPSTIPWLLLDAAKTEGNGIFGKTSSLQRLDTVGGKAPTSGCNSRAIGKKVRVPYTANYYFYQKK